MFSVDKEYIYDKSPEETLNDINAALEKIGSVKTIDHDNRKISGKARYGLQTAKIEAELEAIDSKTKILFHGKSDDVQGMGANKVIERLFETMGNLDNPEFTASKSGISFSQIAAYILSIIFGLFIGFIFENQWVGVVVLAIGVFLISYFFSKSRNSRN